jgi:hypothetical protein
LNAKFGVVLPDDKPGQLRPNLARYLLIGSFLAEISGAIPENLSGIPHAIDDVQKTRSLAVVSEWQK